MLCMQAFESILAFQRTDWVDLYGPIILLAAIIFLVVLVLVRGGRNYTLEQTVALDEFASPSEFHGTLVANQIGSRLQLSSSTKEARRLRFLYRWIMGSGPQAKFDEVAFDGPRGLVEMRAGDKLTSRRFSEFSTLRLRERSAGRGGGSLWHLELIQCDGKAIPFVSSAIGDRKFMFEQTAAVAKAISVITSLPIQIFVAGNIWTPGWPPKSRVSSS